MFSVSRCLIGCLVSAIALPALAGCGQVKFQAPSVGAAPAEAKPPAPELEQVAAAVPAPTSAHRSLPWNS